eukprot:gene30097-35063_t
MNMFGSGIGGMKGWEGYDMIGKWSLTLEAKGLGYPRDFMDYNNLVISLMTGGSLSMDDDQHLGYLAQMSVIPSNHGEWDRLSYVSYAEEDMQEEEDGGQRPPNGNTPYYTSGGQRSQNGNAPNYTSGGQRPPNRNTP